MSFGERGVVEDALGSSGEAWPRIWVELELGDRGKNAATELTAHYLNVPIDCGL